MGTHGEMIRFLQVLVSLVQLASRFEAILITRGKRSSDELNSVYNDGSPGLDDESLKVALKALRIDDEDKTEETTFMGSLVSGFFKFWKGLLITVIIIIILFCLYLCYYGKKNNLKPSEVIGEVKEKAEKAKAKAKEVKSKAKDLKAEYKKGKKSGKKSEKKPPGAFGINEEVPQASKGPVEKTFWQKLNIFALRNNDENLLSSDYEYESYYGSTDKSSK